MASLSDIRRVTKQLSGRTEKEIWHADSYLSLVYIFSFTDVSKSVVNVAIMHLE